MFTTAKIIASLDFSYQQQNGSLKPNCPLDVEVFPSESDELSQQLPSTTVSHTQELGSSVLSRSVSSGPALVSAKATSPPGAPQLSEDDTNKIIENLFKLAQIDKMHNFYRCRSTGCPGISKEALDSLKMTKKRDLFQHEWLFRKETSFCSQTGIWCLVYVENEGMYCLLCRKHKSKSAQNRSETFSNGPSTRFKWNAVTEHNTTVKNELPFLCTRIKCNV